MWKEVLNFSLKNGGTLTATQANIWQGSLTIEQSVSADDTFELGSTHIGQMTVTLADLQVSQIQDATFSLNTEGHLILDGERVPYQTVYANVDFADAVVVVYMAQDDDTLTQMGVYNVVQTTRDDGIISITAYDNMDKLSEVYTTALTFPSTYGAMANEITGQLLTFDGSTTAVAGKPEAEDLTKREVLGYIAQACGYNVLCNPQGYFQFVRYNLSGFSTQGQYHEISGLYSFHHSQYPVIITGVKVIVTDEEMTTDPDTGDTVAEIVTHEYTAGTDAYQLVIEGNPLITTTNGQSVADALYALYGNVEFYTGDVSHLSDLSIKASDIMKVTDRHNNTFPMLVSRTVISTGSAQGTSSYAEEPSRKIVTQPSQMSRIQNSVRQAAIDAQNGRRIASNTNQYFWHTESGTDTGAHITEIPREDFLADPTSGGGNLLARSNGVAIRYGLNELAQFTNSSINFFDGQGDALSNILAQFGVGGLVLGNNANTRIVINTTNGIRIGDKVEINTNGEATMQNISIDSGVISGFTIRKNSSSAYYPSYSDGEIVPTASGDITADDTTHIITVNADTTVTYTFPATVDGSKASNICYAPIYQFTDEEDVVSSTVIITYLNAGVVINSTQYQSSYRSAGSWYAWLDKANANSATTITVSFTLIAGATIYAYMTYGTDDALTYNTSEFLRVDNPDLPSVYIGINGISVSDKIGLSPNGTVHADTVELSGEGTILELTDSDTERRFLFSNIANDTGKTYADDGVYPHRATFYGGNAQSPIALGAWDGRNQHTIWRYNDHDQYLELHNRVRVGGKTLNLGNLFKAPGDTWTVDYAGGGYVTDNGKKFQWSVPAPYITGTVSVTALTGYIRQNGNYLVGSSSVTGTFPIGNITVEKMTGFVRFTYDASSAPTGVTNNDAISVQLHIVFRVA